MTNHFDDKMHVLVFTGDIKFFPFEGRNATQKINAEFRINIPDWMCINILNDDYSVPSNIIKIEKCLMCGFSIWCQCLNCNTRHSVTLRINSDNVRIEPGIVGITIIKVTNLNQDEYDDDIINNFVDDESESSYNDPDCDESNDDSELLCNIHTLYNIDNLVNFISEKIEPHDLRIRENLGLL